MNCGERTSGPATLTLSEWQPQGLGKQLAQQIRVISHLRTCPECRGRGHTRWLLAEVCREADLAGIVLVVEPRPDADSPIDAKDLCEMYAKRGFVQVNDEPLLMARQPKRCESAT